MPSFTNEQNKAIYTQGCDVLVAAAAGSGKTAVLVRRIIEIISHKEKPVDIDKLLVVTFTEAAAAEMRQRIGAAIDEILLIDSQNEHMLRQKAILSSADISTIHSFCLKVIRNNFHLTDLDPSFSVVDETESSLMKTQAMEELLEEEYEKEDNIIFYNIVDSYCGGKVSDAAIEDLILRMHEFIESAAWPEQSAEQYAAMYDISDNDIDNTPWAEILKDEIKRTLDGAHDSADYLVRLCRLEDGPQHYIPTLLSDINVLKNISQQLSGSLHSIYEILQTVEFDRLKSAKGNYSKEISATVQDVRKKEIKEPVTHLHNKLFFCNPDKMLEDTILIAPIVRKLISLTLSFRKRYNDLKKEKNKADFNDLEHYCLDILMSNNNGNITATKAAKELRERYHQVLTDEYQDTNAVQECILSAISDSNRFMVGDIKQSIYRFRRAKPELFIEKYNNFSYDFGLNNISGIKIDLSKNFRSRKNILDTVNYFFSQLMSEDAGDAKYDKNAALYPGAEFPSPESGDNISQSVDITVINLNNKISKYNNDESETEIEALSKLEWEARAVACKILDMTGTAGLNVLDKETQKYRTAIFSDIAVLTSTTNDCEIIRSELNKYGIPAYTNMKTGFYETLEISTIISFLQIIDNPRQDIHLITVLRSPVYSLTPDELLEIRHINVKADLFDCINEYIKDMPVSCGTNTQNKLARFICNLNEWRNHAVYTELSRLISIIYTDTNYYNYAAVMSGGEIRQANLRSLREQAVKYEKSGFKSLFNFIKYIEKIKNTGADTGEAGVLPENENVVKIMTIHKSKGLEFPIVFVCRLDKKFNTSDKRQSVVLHEDLGFGSEYVDLQRRVKKNTLPRFCIANKLHIEDISEKKRVLYVAMTRAREKLVLIGCVNNLDSKMNKWKRFEQYEKKELPANYIINNGNFLDWVMVAAIRGSSDDGFNVTILSTDEIFIADEKLLETEKHELKPSEKISPETDYSGMRSKVYSDMAWEYPYEYAKSLPSKVSISEIKRAYYKEMLKDSTELEFLFSKPVYNFPDFIKSETEISPAKRGTAIHTVMEHLDLDRYKNIDDINKLISELVSKNMMTEEESKIVPVYKIINFINSPVADRVRQSNSVHREVPFVIGLNPKEIYFNATENNMNNETILVHGIIDCFFEENGQIILLDYKSDRASEKDIENIKNRYSIQMEVYKKAVERSTGKKVMESLLYLFSLDKAISL